MTRLENTRFSDGHYLAVPMLASEEANSSCS